VIATSTKEGMAGDRFREEIRQTASRPWWRTAYAAFLGALIIMYGVGYGAVLYATDGLPYVLDNNESFSTLLHATNMYTFGISKSFGITDEATGPNPEAHPYVHTHQGNFPRIFGFLIYALGARTIESQIVVTTFTVGTLVVLMAYHVFARLAGPLLAFVACLTLLSDYILVAQWQVNTYRVWQFFLVFSSLMCARGLGGDSRRLWLGLTFVNALALFYCELVSVAFTSMLAGLFAISLYWRQPRRIIAWAVAHTAGGLSALFLLIFQLIAYLGWENFLVDIRLTFGARNFGAENEELRNRIIQFYEQNNILFWHNFVDGAPLRSLAAFIDLHTRYVFQVYTPILTLVVLIVTVGWVLGLSWGYGRVWWLRRWSGADSHPAILRVRALNLYANVSWEIGLSGQTPIERRQLCRANRIFRFTLLLVPISIAVFMVIQGESIAGLPSTPASGQDLLIGAVVALAAGAGASMVLTKVRTGSWLAFSRMPLWRLCTVAILLLVVSKIIDLQPRAYDQAYRTIWYDPIVAIVPLWVERIALLLALGLGVTMCLFGTERILGEAWTSRLGGLGIYLLCSGVAYFITYNLATGYVQSGYVTRMAPLPVFFVGVLVAFAGCIVVAAVARAWSTHARRADGSRTITQWSPSVLGATVGLLLVWMAGYWTVLNGTYMTLIPPTQLSALFKQFARPPLLGASTVVNNYGSPIAVQSGNWTYYAHFFGAQDTVRRTKARFEVIADPSALLWLADRHVNPAYERPDVFVCMRNPTLASYAIRTSVARDYDQRDCADLPLIRNIERNRQRIVEHKLIDRDPNTPSTWAIVQLDWDFPPYLENPDDRPSDEVVGLVLTPGVNIIAAQVQYEYVQQDGAPERQSIVRLHVAGADGRWCVYERSSSRSSFTLPADFRGKIRASVTPRSATKAGREVFGKTLTIGDGQGAPCVGKE
jgi:hypothetical protein